MPTLKAQCYICHNPGTYPMTLGYDEGYFYCMDFQACTKRLMREKKNAN